MKTLIHVSFNQGEAKYWSVRQLLGRIGCAEDLAGLETPFPGLYQRTFDADDPKLKELRSSLHKAGVQWSEIEDRIYDADELRGFPLLWLALRRPLIEGGGARCGTEYDTSSGCPNCGTGAKQISSLIVPQKSLPKKGHICQTHEGEILVSDTFAEALRSKHVTGLDLQQVQSHRSNKPLPWWQMISTYTMPRMSSKTKGMEHDMRLGWGCPVCKRDCYEGMNEMIYSRNDVRVDTLPDVAQTWECFGRSLLRDDPERALVRGFAQPLILVKPKVFDVFQRVKVRQAEFQPVLLK